MAMGVLEDLLMKTRQLRWETLMKGMELVNGGFAERAMIERHLNTYFDDIDQQEKDRGNLR